MIDCHSYFFVACSLFVSHWRRKKKKTKANRFVYSTFFLFRHDLIVLLLLLRRNNCFFHSKFHYLYWSLKSPLHLQKKNYVVNVNTITIRLQRNLFWTFDIHFEYYYFERWISVVILFSLVFIVSCCHGCFLFCLCISQHWYCFQIRST